MDTRRDAVGQWATLPVRAPDHDSAVSRARAAARRSGYRVDDIAQATRQGDGRQRRVTRIVRGDTVAHSPGATRHIVRVIQDRNIVGALCGTVLHGPRRSGLVGPECPTCRDLAGRTNGAHQRIRDEADL